MTAPAALITGGTTGIGRATAELLHERGFRVVVTGRNPDTIAAARAELPDGIAVVQADSASLDDADRLADEVRETVGELTGLFLNAGITRPSPLESVDEATWDELFAVNAKGQFFTLQRLLPVLTDGASVVCTVGIGATRGIAGGSITAGSRGALLTMLPSLALELAPRHIRINAVSPGAIDTPIWSKGGLAAEEREKLTAAIAARVPFGRLGSALEVAEAVAFLLSDRAAYVTGQELVVGGGIGLSS